MPSFAPRRVVSPAVVAGGLAASATVGALIAMGRRLGNMWLPFAAVGAALAHRTVSSEAAGLVVLGLALHVLLSFVWAMVFVSLVTRGWRQASAGAVIGISEIALSWIVSLLTGNGLASVLPLGDRLELAVVSAASLVVGLRLAVGPPRNAPNSRGLHESARGETRM
jgi:hypothetical protein